MQCNPIPLVAVGILALGGALAVTAQEAVDHYEAKPSETLEEAVANFSEYNGLLADVLAKEELTGSDMERVHELTYTLEVALAKINATMEDLPATLESLHLASEAHNPAEVRGVGGAYLEVAQTVVP